MSVKLLYFSIEECSKIVETETLFTMTEHIDTLILLKKNSPFIIQCTYKEPFEMVIVTLKLFFA